MKRRVRKRCGILLLAFGFVFMPFSAQAVIISDSLNVFAGPFPPGYSLGAEWTTAHQQGYVGATFRTDSNAYTLKQVTLAIRSTFYSTPGIPVVDLYTASGTQPGARIGTLAWAAPSQLPGMGSDYAWVEFITQGMLLLPSTTYWVVLHSAFGDIDWSYARQNPLGPGGWPTCYGTGFLPGLADSNDGGQTWYTSGGDLAQRLRVEADPVPEPTTLLLIGSGLAGTAAMRIRRRFKK